MTRNTEPTGAQIATLTGICIVVYMLALALLYGFLSVIR